MEKSAKKKGLYDGFADIVSSGQNGEVLFNWAEGTPMYPSPPLFWETIAPSQPDADMQPAEEASAQEIQRVEAEHKVRTFLKQYYCQRVESADRLIKEEHIFVGNGADDLLSSFMRAYLSPGSQVVTFAPTYMYYFQVLQELDVQINRVFLRRDGDRISFCAKEFRQAITPQVKLILLNSPQNPTSWVLNAEEMKEIREVCLEFPDIVVVSDEVYLNICTKPGKFASISCLPDMFERTLSIHSIGKTFSGNSGQYKFGYAIGPQKLQRVLEEYNAKAGKARLDALQLSRLSRLLERAEQPYEGRGSYYEWNHWEYQLKRQQVSEALASLGLSTIPSEGGYFLLLDISDQLGHIPAKYYFDNSTLPEDYSGPESFGSLESWKSFCRDTMRTGRSPDFAFCYFWAAQRGVAFWPVSGFTDYQNLSVPLEQRRLTELVRVSLTRDQDYIHRFQVFAKGLTN